MSQVRPPVKPGEKRETALGKFWGKTKQDPFVPIGAVATGGVLAGGLWSMYQNNPNLSQRFMRIRIIAQGFTVVVLCVGEFALPCALRVIAPQYPLYYSAPHLYGFLDGITIVHPSDQWNRWRNDGQCRTGRQGEGIVRRQTPRAAR